jgi:hypothetical protein
LFDGGAVEAVHVAVSAVGESLGGGGVHVVGERVVTVTAGEMFSYDLRWV